MAKLLGIPTNTLYRWETASTSPDASSLASIYSVAIAHGIRPDFFVRRNPVQEKTKGRQRLIVMWDFQNIGVSGRDIPEVGKRIRESLISKFSSTKQHLFKAFGHPAQSEATDILSKIGWRVWEDDEDMDEEIIDQSRSDCGSEPSTIIFVLITKDGDFVELIEELKTKGVRVYLMAPETVSEDLVAVVGKKRFIPLEELISNNLKGDISYILQTDSYQDYDDYDD